MTDVNLTANETMIAQWRPAFRVFLRKLLVVSGLTALILGSGVSSFFDMAEHFGSLLGLLIWIPIILVTMLFYAFVFDDFREWPVRRADQWTLTTTRLLYSNPREEHGRADVPLTEIVSLRGWMGWSLRAKLSTRQVITLAYLPNIRDIRSRLQSAIDLAKRGAHV